MQAASHSVGAVSERDWLEWHAPYDDPSSALSRRLEVVQRLLAEALAPPDTFFGVGAHRFEGSPRPVDTVRLFAFVGFDGLASSG